MSDDESSPFDPLEIRLLCEAAAFGPESSAIESRIAFAGERAPQVLHRALYLQNEIGGRLEQVDAIRAARARNRTST